MKAVIDIGSNSVRLMLDKKRHGLNIKETVTTRLGQGLAHSRRLSEADMLRTVSAVKELYELSKAEDADEVYVFATEAVRAAQNGRAFAAMVESKVGVPVDVLDPRTEAKVGYMGATEGLKGTLAVIDVGGASTEIALGLGEEIEREASIPIGAVRLKAEAGENIDAMRHTVCALLGGLPDPSKAETVIAIGGTATSLAAADLNLSGYAPYLVHHHRLTAEAIDMLVEAFAASKDITLDFPAIERKRAQIVLQGAVIYQCLTRQFGLKGLIVSETDNCEGYLAYRLTQNA